MLKLLAGCLKTVTDTRQKGKVRHDLVEMILVAYLAILAGANNCCDIERWGQLNLSELRQFPPLKNGIASRDTYCKILASIETKELEIAFMIWVTILADLKKSNKNRSILALDGKTSRRSGRRGEKPLHLVTAFDCASKMIMGQQACDKKSNEIKPMHELLQKLKLDNRIVTMDAMGAQTKIAKAIRENSGDYVLAVKHNHRALAESIDDFHKAHLLDENVVEHDFARTVEKDHGRFETRMCYAFNQVEYLDKPERWEGLKSFAVVICERTVNGRKTVQKRFYISSLPADAKLVSHAVRSHWGIENNLHWILDNSFEDDHMRLRTENSANNMAIIKHGVYNILRWLMEKSTNLSKKYSTIDSFRMLMAHNMTAYMKELMA